MARIPQPIAGKEKHRTAERPPKKLPCIEQRNLHPGHIWQVDASACVELYLSINRHTRN